MIKNVGVIGSLRKTAAYTMTLADFGKLLIVDSATDVTITLPSTLPDGFTFSVLQNSTGKAVFSIAGRAVNSNAARVGTAYPFDTAEVFICDNNATVMVIFGVPLPTLQGSNSAALSSTATALAAVPGLSFPLLAGGVYDVDYRVSASTASGANAAKIGMSALPSGALCQLEAIAYTSATAVVRTQILTSAALVSGFSAGNGPNSGPYLSVIKGRINVGSTGGTLNATFAASSTAAAVTVAIAGATMECRQIY